MKFSKTIWIAAAAALTMTAASGCDKSESSSADSQEESKTLAEQLSDNLTAGDYAVDMVISGDAYGTDMPCKMISKNGNGYVSMTVSGVYTEFYTVDSKTYMLMPDISCYQLTGDEGTFGNALFVIGEGDTLTDEKTEDGVVTEVYTSDGETFTFNFDEESGSLKSFTSETSDGTTNIAINSINFSGADIVLPDLSGWQDISDDEIDETTQLKLALYYMGVTEDMLAEAGYTYDDLAKMNEEERTQALADMGVNIYG